MKVEQFVMAYGVEQDRLRALLPEGFVSLRPVLRINAELRDEGLPGEDTYLEFNTPVAAEGKRGWLNIAAWHGLRLEREGKTVRLEAPFLTLTWTGVGIEGGCPAERDNDGCFYPGREPAFRPAERIGENKEFCDCAFAWHFREGDARGRSEGVTLPAVPEAEETAYERQPLTPENAAAIPCRQVLGCYLVRFER